jgi:hypothetical protein
MGLISGRATFRRVSVEVPAGTVFGEPHLEALQVHADSSQASVDGGVDVNWRAGKHILDRQFSMANVYPDHLAWDLGVTADRLPPGKLRAYYEVELQALAANNPSGFASARQKREAKEIAQERLEQEARDGRYRHTKTTPCLWDGQTSEVLLGATSSKTLDRFLNLFATSFVTPKLVTGYMVLSADSLARRFATSDQLANLVPSPFVPGANDPNYYWSLGEGDCAWLGNEFALWLWWHTEIVSDTIPLTDGSECTVMLARELQLECPHDITGREKIKHEGPTRLPEAKRAAQSGKVPRQIGMTFVHHDEQTECRLDVEAWTIAGMKVSTSDDDGDSARDRLISRFERLRGAIATLDGLYEVFVTHRVGNYWPETLGRMQRWLSREKREAA